MILFACLAETAALFSGLILWFVITQEGSSVVTTNLTSLLSALMQSVPPVPAIDVLMVLRLGLLVLIAWYLSETPRAYEIAEDMWNSVVVYLADLSVNFLHIITFFYDMVVPLYNWYATLAAQITTGTYTILAKCQLRGIIESVSLLAEAMAELARAFAAFIAAPKGALDVFDVAIYVQEAAKGQESVLKCACDGLTPALGIAFDVVRPPQLAGVINETVNAFVGVPQTLILAIPPFLEVPDLSRITSPLRRSAAAFGEYVDAVTSTALRRILKDAEPIPIATPIGHFVAAGIGVVESVAHVSTHLILNRTITYDPTSIHKSLMLAANLEPTIKGLIGPVADQIGLNVSPLAKAVQNVFEAVFGVPSVALSYVFFILRGDHTGLSFMETLQHMDGKYGEVPEMGQNLQAHVFQPLERALDNAMDIASVFSFIPITLKVFVRLANVLVRVVFSAEDIVQNEFFHAPINCGYGTNEQCGECDYFTGEPTTNPCNAQVGEWVFSAMEEYADSLDSLFKAIKPQHGDDWCALKQFPQASLRCAESNSDFLCATGTTMRTAVDAVVDALRTVYNVAVTPFSEPGDVNRQTLDASICNLNRVLYAAAGNIVAVFPNDIIGAQFKERVTDLVHSVLTLPIAVARMYTIGAQFVFSLVSGISVDWDDILDAIDDELIRSDRVQRSVATKDTSEMATNVGKVLVAEIMTGLNYLINVFDSAGALLPDGNFLEGGAKVLSTIKNALSKELINWVSLIFKIGGNILAMLTTGDVDLSEIINDLIKLVVDSINILAGIATRIVASLLKMLGPIGDFIVIIWKGLCLGATIVSMFGIDMSGMCDAVEGRRLSDHILDLGEWDGNAECDRLIRHFNGQPWSNLTPLEQIRVADCEEQRVTMQTLNAMLDVKLPEDVLYNWKRKYAMLYEFVHAAYLYTKHDSPASLMAEWNQAELPMYWLDIWDRLRDKVPWLGIIDEALLSTLKPIPEAHSIYETSKQAMQEIHEVWKTHRSVELPRLAGVKILGTRYHKLVSKHTLAWGLSTNPDLEGPLNCAVADNFVKAMDKATQRTLNYYSDTFTRKSVPFFTAWLQDLPFPFDDIGEPTPAREWNLETTAEWIKKTILYSFETCEPEQITCLPGATTRISESLWYVLYTLTGAAAVSALTGFSLFALLPLLVLIPLAHVWNFRFMCLPNMPECLFDDILMWLRTYRPGKWNFKHNVTACNDSPLWSPTYLLRDTPIVKAADFVLYDTTYYDDFTRWTESNELNDECSLLKAPDLAYVPAIAYGVYASWNVISYGVRVAVTVVQSLLFVASTAYTIEKQ